MLATLQGLDGGLLLAIQGLRQDWLDPIAAGFTTLGNAGVLWIVLSALMLCWRPTRKAGLLALLAMLLGLVCTNLTDRKSTRLNSSHLKLSRMPSSA